MKRGKTYYVSAIGNDTNTGLSEALSWKTLAKVTASSFLPGDTIALRKGDTWYEGMSLTSNGAPGLPITYTSYGSGAKPIISGITAVDNTGWTDDGAGKYHKDLPFFACSAFYEDGKGVPMALDATLAVPSSGPRFFYSGTTIYYAPSSGAPVAHTLARLNISFGINTTSLPRSYVVIDGIHFYQSEGVYLPTSASPGGGGIDHITIQNCNFEDSPQGIFTAQKNNNLVQYITVQNNTFANCGVNFYSTIESTDAGNSHIYVGHNTVTGSNKTISGGYWQQVGDRDGFGFQNLSNSIIEHNDISGGCPSDAAITIWNDPTNLNNFTGNVIRYNFLHDVDNYGIAYDAGPAPASQHSIDIYYNIIARCPQDGLRLNSTQATSFSTVSNNVVYGCGYGLHLYSGPDYYKIRNNIFANCSTSLGRLDAPVGSNVLSNNVYQGGSTGTPFSWGGTPENWEWWVSKFVESGSLTSDPMFVNPGTDFHVKTGSPALHAGVNVGIAVDYSGVRVSCMPNIGAYEGAK